MPRLILFPFSTSPFFLVFTNLKILKILCVYYKMYKISTLTKTFPVFPLGWPSLVRLCSMSFLPPGFSLCVSSIICKHLYKSYNATALAITPDDGPMMPKHIVVE
jgi:hypothetical protein